MRIIDAHRLIEILEGFGEWDGGENTYLLGIATAKALINDAPTVDYEKYLAEAEERILKDLSDY